MLAIIVAAAIGCVAPPAPADSPRDGLAALRTRAESSNYAETTRFDEVMAFVRTADAATPRLQATSFGYSLEGRALPLVVVGEAADASAEAVRATQKTRVLVMANIHAGEVEGKEAMLALLRALAQGEHAEWFESMVLLVAPIYNADGNERVTLTNRPHQLGPVGGMGQRPNAQGLDLNRDFMKLDSPEARSLVRLLTDYDPHVVVDLHTTNGTYHAYHLTYSPPLHPNTPRAIVEFLRGRLLPAATAAIKAQNKWDFFYYGNVPDADEPMPRGWYTFDHRPRFGNNYVGLRNRLAVLSEAFAYLDFETRIAVTRRFVEEILAIVYGAGEDIRAMADAADHEVLAGQRLATRAMHARTGDIDVLMGEVARERHPLTGEVVLRRLDVSRPERMPDFSTFEAAETERVPTAYVIPTDLDVVLDRLSAHGIRTRRLERDTSMTVNEFVIDASTAAERVFQGHRERTLTGQYRAAQRRVPAGSVLVPMDQPLGRLAFTLLEPRSDDGFVAWGLVDSALEGARVFPVLSVP
jgi:hypothetical protein